MGKLKLVDPTVRPEAKVRRMAQIVREQLAREAAAEKAAAEAAAAEAAAANANGNGTANRARMGHGWRTGVVLVLG